MTTTTRCPRCNAPLRSLTDLAVVAGELAEKAGRAREALATMRLAIPDTVPAFLADAAARGPALAEALACHAGRCPERRRPTREAAP